MFPKWLWISVIAFSILEWASIPFLFAFSVHTYQVIDHIFTIAFVLYPLFFLVSLLLLPSGTKRGGALVLLIPLIVYTPLLMTLQSLVK